MPYWLHIERHLFANGETIVGHGGISIDELIVPLIQIERRGNMNNRQKQIGFSQRIRLEWLQYTANLVLAGNDNAAVQRFTTGTFEG